MIQAVFEPTRPDPFTSGKTVSGLKNKENTLWFHRVVVDGRGKGTIYFAV